MTTPPAPPDPFGQLAGPIQAGDERAFRTLFDGLYDPLVRFALGIVRDVTAAEDLVQEAFVRTWDRRSSLAPDQPLRAYLYRIVRNLSLNHLRDDRTRQRLLDDVSLVGTAVIPQAAVAPGEHLTALELGEELTRLIAALPARQREAITLSRIEGLSHDEVADVMGCAPRTVNNHLVAALAFLRQQLSGALVASLSWMLS